MYNKVNRIILDTTHLKEKYLKKIYVPLYETNSSLLYAYMYV